MEYLNSVNIRGVIGVIDKKIINNVLLLRFSLMTLFSYRDEGNGAVVETSWFNVVFYGKASHDEFANLKKGSVVEVNGRLRIITYTNANGDLVRNHEIVARRLSVLDIGISLEPQALSPIGLPQLKANYREAKKELIQETVKSLYEKTNRTGTGRVIFQEPALAGVVNVHKGIALNSDGLTADYLIVAVERENTTGEEPSVVLIGWDSVTEDIKRFCTSEFSVDELTEIDEAIDYLYDDQPDIRLEGQDRFVLADNHEDRQAVNCSPIQFPEPIDSAPSEK